MTLITTSRRPSSRTRSLCKDLVRVIPDSKQINRGKTSSDKLLSYAKLNGARSLIVVHSNKGNPSLITLTSTDSNSRSHASCKFNVTSVKLQREFLRPKFDPPKKLYVLVAKESEELEELAEKISRFLGGRLVRTSDIVKRHPQRSADGIVLILQAESQDNISLAFARLVDFQEIGPSLRMSKKNAFCHLGGSQIE